MKKSILLPLLSILSLLFVLIACKKEVSDSSHKNPKSEALSLQRTVNRSSLPLEIVSLLAREGINYNSLSLDSVALIHNDAMEYIVDRVFKDNICPEDNEKYRTRFASYIEDYLSSKGLDAKININSIEGARAWDDLDFCSTDFELSQEATNLTCLTQNVFDDFSLDKLSPSEFTEKINNIISDANNLKDPEEKRVVQLAATICRSSAFFWKENLPRLREKLMSHCSNVSSGLAQRNNIPWGAVAYADASGAITWGRVGFFAAGGPAGAVACGLAGAAGHSALRLLTFGIFGN